jgi:hypothetical protein
MRLENLESAINDAVGAAEEFEEGEEETKRDFFSSLAGLWLTLAAALTLERPWTLLAEAPPEEAAAERISSLKKSFGE